MVKDQLELLPQNHGLPIEKHQVFYVDLSKALCNENGCQIMQEGTFEPFFSDDNHFAMPGAKVALDYILQQVIPK